MSSPRSPRKGSWGKSWFSFRADDRTNLINVVDSYTQELYVSGPGIARENYKVLGSLDLTSDDASEMQWVTSATINTRILRRHFQELTEAFLGQLDPFARGFYQVKSKEEILVCLSNQDTFPEVLTQSIEKQKLVHLYERFIHDSPNFSPWFESRGGKL